MRKLVSFSFFGQDQLYSCPWKTQDSYSKNRGGMAESTHVGYNQPSPKDAPFASTALSAINCMSLLQFFTLSLLIGAFLRITL